MKRTCICIMLLISMIIIALISGRYGNDVSEIWKAFLFQGNPILQSVVWNLRIPRILMVMVSGAALSLSGIVYQTIFKNPLASGDVIGASSGCSLGAIIAIKMTSNMYAIEGMSFLFGILLVAFTFALASRMKGNRILNLVVAGLVLQAFATSLMMLFKLRADPQHELANMEYWLMGGFSDITWQQVILTIIIACICCFILYRIRWQIQLLGYGDEAQSIGVYVKRIRICALLLATLLLSCVISIAGIVSWVGLLVPHMIRLLSKKPLSQNFGLTILCGAFFLLLCDTLSRSLFTIEIPISILTSLFGALFLLILFIKGRLSL